MSAVLQLDASAILPAKAKRLRRRVLEADPSQEYLIYVPSGGGKNAPLFVSVHGVSRNADQHAGLLSAYCEMYGAVMVAPVFSEESHPDYQRLGRLGRGKRADLALKMIVAETARLTGCRAETFHLFGYSGGAQFAHRFAMAHPHRIASAVVASAGWFTMPDPKRRFPYGTRVNKKLPGVRFDAEEFLSVPMTVMVGELDDKSAGVRRSPALDREQGVNRVERARRWVDAMVECANAHHLESRVNLVVIKNGGHSFKRSILRNGLGDKVFEAVFGPLQRTASSDGR